MIMDQRPSPKPVAAWLMLISRCVLFLFFQVVIALVLLLLGHANAWDESAGWWLYAVIPANLVSVYLLVILFKAEGKRYLDLLRFTKGTVGKDLLWLLGSSVVGVPAMALPLTNLAVLIFGNAMEPVNMMFK